MTVMNLLNHRCFSNILLLLAIIIAVSFKIDEASSGTREDHELREAAFALDLNRALSALRAGANPNAASPGPRPMTPLAWTMFGTAAKGPQSTGFEIAKELFNHGASLGVHDREILFFPISNGDMKLIDLLVANGASLTYFLEGYSPTQLALKYNQFGAYELLVARGAEPVRKQDRLQLELISAIDSAILSDIKVALGNGAKINIPSPNGTSALLSAIRMPIYTQNQADVIFLLLDAGADPNLTSESWFNDLEGIPLHVLVTMNSYTMNSENPPGKRPVIKGLTDSVLLRILGAGARISALDSKSRTPLHWAAKTDNLRAAEILLDSGARIMPRDIQGKTPLDYAESATMIKLLKGRGAKEQ